MSIHLSVDHIKLKKQFLQDITNLVLVMVMKIFDDIIEKYRINYCSCEVFQFIMSTANNKQPDYTVFAFDAAISRCETEKSSPLISLYMTITEEFFS